MNQRARNILWLDGGAGGVVGILMFAFLDGLASLYGMSLSLVTLIATANLTYAAYSGSLATLASLNKPIARRAIDILVVANLAWAVVCAGVVIANFRHASVFGLAHVALEGFFVIGLARSEYQLVRPYTRRADKAPAPSWGPS